MYKYFIAATVAIILLWVAPARAFTISPTRYLVTVNPGDVRTVRLNIKNDEGGDKKFKVFVVGLKQQENGVLSFNENTDLAEGWVQSEKDKVLIKKGQEETVNFVISIPKDVSPGSHYLGLTAEAEIEGGVGGAISGRLFAILILRVAGEAREAISIEDWKGSSFVWNKNWPVALELKNIGNIDVPLKGEVEINYGGRLKEKNDWSLGNNLLAGSSRYLEKNISPKIFWPGKYEIQIKINYGRTGQMGVAIFSIWYFPLWSLLGAPLVLFLFWLLYFKIRRHHVKI